MTLIVQCRTCGRELRSQDRYAGMRVRCPQCGTISDLPGQASPLPCSANCDICGKDFTSQADLVKDTRDRYYHRSCYDQARQQQTDPPPAGEPARPQGTAAADSSAASGVENDGLGQLEPTVDDLWKELSGAGGGIPTGTPWQPDAMLRRSSAWMYVMMGFAAAVPVVALLFILMQLIVNSLGFGPAPVAPGSLPAVSIPHDVGPNPVNVQPTAGLRKIREDESKLGSSK